MKLYRYAAQRYTDSLMNMGSLRVGTLHDYRRMEHKKGIGDAEEGKKVIVHEIFDLNEQNIKTEHARANELFKLLKIEGGGRVRIGKVNIKKTYDHPDCFVLCLSHQRSKSVMSSLDGTDSCLELGAFLPFLNTLSGVLNENVPLESFIVGHVTYQSREEIWNGKDFGVHPAFVKGMEYKKQAEVRIIWEPKYGQQISPIIVNDIKLSQYFRSVKV